METGDESVKKEKRIKGIPYIYFLKTQISIKICTLQFIILSIKVNRLTFTSFFWILTMKIQNSLNFKINAIWKNKILNNLGVKEFKLKVLWIQITLSIFIIIMITIYLMDNIQKL